MRKAFICPSKYVQGPDEILNLGYFVSTYGKKALLIAHKDDVARVKEKLDKTAKEYGVEFVAANFGGEASREEVARLQEVAKKNKCDCIVGLGGGKAIDTAKCVAEGHNLIIVPTIAATDAPTSHSAVLYHPDGSFDDYAYFIQNPSVVLIDTTVIANAPTRFLVSGMGDALSTYFEARANVQSFGNVNAGLPCGANREKGTLLARGTKTAFALAELCYKTLLEEGYKAMLSCEAKVVTPALENIVEANILLSGLGFESGGLAAAHAIHDGLTVLEEAHHFFHGEKVAFGTLCQLVLENAPEEEIFEVIDFCLNVGLPVCLEDLGVKDIGDRIYEVAQKACIPEESIHFMPFPVTEDDVVAAILAADKIGRAARGLD
ncbi:MAG TPA: glycerol dehydrogenase [Clostridiales bacterium]|nr:glycerol dehydrogenase [Clostridiales bacterium]